MTFYMVCWVSLCLLNAEKEEVAGLRNFLVTYKTLTIYIKLIS